jgi:hypothetical protein
MPGMEFRVPMVEVEVVVAMTEAEPCDCVIFLAPYSHRHDGFETIDEYLNGPRTFFPMRVEGVSKLVNREQLLWVRAPRFPSEVAYMVAEAQVIFELINGLRVEGKLELNRPVGQARISDLLNSPQELFVSLRDGDETYFVNKHHIRQAILK